ncbi:ectomycorrhiza-regulated esterase [Sparassis latifolia]|uniref:Alpha/beta-hydrolase n=1 Tax=Sparassis crispa TaxID=139825 RepID=A0A401GRQ5_9APHY|nr:alpha/beta-hydrolase [Sparassis crispa]GBE84908.1 alpha/beta-hydrolase [Sparassis crispa]
MDEAPNGRKSTKLSIHHPHEPNCAIVGVLEQLSPHQSTQGRRIALLLHGSLGHKDYLFLKPLALRLPMDNFRFDFRANHETPGTWRFGSVLNDCVDIQVVVDYLTKEYGYIVDLVVGHSRGSVAGLLWLCKAEESKHVRGFINVSGRYRMKIIYDHLLDQENKQSLKTRGYFEMKATVARKPFVGRVTRPDLDDFANTDTSVAWTRFPSSIDVLTIHGIRDGVVPVYDAIIYAQAYGGRTPGTHTLHLVERADHNFTGLSEEVVSIILQWWQKVEHREVKTGLWDIGCRGSSKL